MAKSNGPAPARTADQSHTKPLPLTHSPPPALPMKTPFLSRTTGGILAIFLGLVFLALSSHQASKNHEFIEKGLSREGRVISHQQADDEPEFLLRLMTNVSAENQSADMKIIEIPVQEGDFEKAPVGSLLKLTLIPGDPPRSRLAASTKHHSYHSYHSYRFGYVFGSFAICLGILLLWLDWRTPPASHSAQRKKQETHDKDGHHSSSSQESAETQETQETQEAQEARPLARLSDFMERQHIKDPILYHGAFEFSYSAEKTRVELKDGTQIRVSQYRPISDLQKVLADQDLLHVLRSAQGSQSSQSSAKHWELPDSIESGQLALHHLLKEKHLSEADQFFINGPYLGLLYRDEIENGQWYSLVRGIWKITPLSHCIAQLTSADPARARDAALEILHHPNLALIASLAPGLPAIRAAYANQPQLGDSSEAHHPITRAAEVIDALANGHCYCQVHANSSDPPQSLIEKKKFTRRKGKAGDKDLEISCHHCLKRYQVTQQIGEPLPHFTWEEKKQLLPPRKSSSS